MKNPWMSAWLSAANQAAGAGRGSWMAEEQRQQQAWAKEMAKVWTAALQPPGKAPRRSRQQ